MQKRFVHFRLLFWIFALNFCSIWTQWVHRFSIFCLPPFHSLYSRSQFEPNEHSSIIWKQANLLFKFFFLYLGHQQMNWCQEQFFTSLFSITIRTNFRTNFRTGQHTQFNCFILFKLFSSLFGFRLFYFLYMEILKLTKNKNKKIVTVLSIFSVCLFARLVESQSMRCVKCPLASKRLNERYIRMNVSSKYNKL